MKLLFITTNHCTGKAFWKYIKSHQSEFDGDQYFELYTKDYDSVVYSNLDEMLKILEQFKPEELVELLIILDYSSLYKYFRELFDGQKLGPISKLFLNYPEVKIWILREGPKDQILFGDKDGEKKYKKNYYHIVKSFIEIKKFGLILKGGCQLFDPSGIRHYLKEVILIKKVGLKENFKYLQSSRKKYFALSVDEETRHSMMWAYALYNFGYSVLPVNTAEELKALNENFSEYDKDISLICRDYDLQFCDIEHIKSKNPEKIPLYWYRGIARKEMKSPELKRLIKFSDSDLSKNNERLPDNFFSWEAFYKKCKNTLIITQIRTGFFFKKENKIIPDKRKLLFLRLMFFKNKMDFFNDYLKYGLAIKKCKLYLKGLSKEIDGIFGLLRDSRIRKRYYHTREFFEISKDRKSENSPMDSHSIPAVNSEIAENLIKKSKYLYRQENYLISALLSSESMEIINGLSISLSLEALFIKQKAELHLDLQIIGIGDISKVVKIRIIDIRRMIYRIACDEAERRRNAKMQIFNDLRKICENYEQFKAADLMYNEVIKAELKISDSTRIYLRRNNLLEKISNIIKKSKQLNKVSSENSFLNKLKIGMKYMKDKLMERKFILDKIVAPFQNSFVWFMIAFSALLFLNSGVTGVKESINYPLMYFALYIFLVIFNRKKIIYYMIGSGVNIKYFFLSFIIFVSCFILMYWFNLPADKISLSELGLYILIASLTFDPSKLLAVISNPIGYTFPLNWLHLLLIFQLSISVLYLGVLISALYRWFVRR